MVLYPLKGGFYEGIVLLREGLVLHEKSDLNKESWITEETLVLTESGWRGVSTIKIGDKVLTNSFDGTLDFEKVQNVTKESQRIVSSYHSFWQFETGIKHRWFGYRRMTKSDNSRLYIYDHKPCTNTTKEFNIVNCGVYKGKSSSVTRDECSLLGWILSDGYVKWAEKSFGPSTSKGKRRGVLVQITQNDNKFGSEIKDLLVSLGAYKREVLRKKSVNVCRDYYLDPTWFRAYWKRMGFNQESKYKINLVKFLLDQPAENIESFLDAFFKADGHTTRKGKGSKVISQNVGNLSESVLVAGYLLGYNMSSGSKGCEYTNKRGETNECYWYKLSDKPHQTTMRMSTDIKPEGTVFNFGVDGYVVCRQKDVITCV